MVLPRYCRFRRASHLHTQPTPLSLFSPEALYSVLIARSPTDSLINLSNCPPLLISTSCLFLLLSHQQQFICLDLFSHPTNLLSQILSFGRASSSSLLNKTSQPVATACSTLSKSNTIPNSRSIGKDTSNTITMSFLSKLTVPHLAVRGIQVLFSLTVMILSAYGTSSLVDDDDIPLP